MLLCSVLFAENDHEAHILSWEDDIVAKFTLLCDQLFHVLLPYNHLGSHLIVTKVEDWLVRIAIALAQVSHIVLVLQSDI